ncbi:MAG: transglycosylase domain-containing protein, partial [Calditrichota bacterium]
MYRLSRDLPDLDQLKQYEPHLATRLLDRNGALLAELYTQKRMLTPLNRIPKHTVNAILTTEDRRFYEHWGVDIPRIFSAAFVNFSTFSIRQGASTITQQLARDLFLHKRQTIARKIREILTAVRIEKHYSKQEILEMYLTQI